MANVVYVIKCTKSNKRYSMLEKRRESSTYKWMAIDWLLHIDSWKNEKSSYFNSEGHSLADLSISLTEQIHREEANFHEV